MNFEIGRFFELFEQRFGVGATTALLALVGAAIAAVSLNLVWRLFVHPVSVAILDALRAGPISDGELLRLGIGTVLAALVLAATVYATQRVVLYRLRKAVAPLLASIRADLDGLKAEFAASRPADRADVCSASSKRLNETSFYRQGSTARSERRCWLGSQRSEHESRRAATIPRRANPTPQQPPKLLFDVWRTALPAIP